VSNALAIASVTRLLKDLLNDALVNGDISSTVGTDVLVTARAPDTVLVSNGGAQPTQLNIFLHRVTPNAALRNMDLPTRDLRGDLVARPRLALDLHYLITAYATEELHTEILLGYAMELFHENPILPREAIRNALQSGVNGSLLPPAFQSAAASALAEQFELIKIVPQTLSMDDMSKLWTALQTHYRTTVAYQISVVLIERDQPKRTPLPVLSRGSVDAATGRDRGVAAQPSLVPSVPTLLGVAAPDEQPAARLGDIVTLQGEHLDLGEARVRFTAPESRRIIELAPLATPTPQEIKVRLPAGAPLPAAHPLAGTGDDPRQWRIGTYGVDAVLRTGDRQRQTNSLPLLLAPQIAPTATTVPTGTQVTITCRPNIREEQPVAVLIGQEEVPVPALAGDTDNVSVVRDNLPAGARLPVRLRVAGVDSLLIDRSTKPPRFDPAQTILVP
jgi:hypothetical protein